MGTPPASAPTPSIEDLRAKCLRGIASTMGEEKFELGYGANAAAISRDLAIVYALLGGAPATLGKS